MLESMILSPRQQQALDEATDFYAAQTLPLEYLESRGITAAAAASSRLGCASEVLPGHENFRSMLVIPYLANGHTVSLKFRRPPGSEGPKYMGLPGQHPRLYGVDALRQGASTVAIVEGELDAILMTHVVGVPAVGVPGANVWMRHHPRCFADVDRVLVVCDNDVATEGNPGQQLAKKIVKDIRGATIIAPPEGDVTDWYLAAGRDAILEALGVDAAC